MENWTRTERFAFYHLLVAILGLFALFVVPGVQSMLAPNSIRLHAQSSVEPVVSNSYDSPAKAVKKIENHSNNVDASISLIQAALEKRKEEAEAKKGRPLAAIEERRRRRTEIESRVREELQQRHEASHKD